MSIGTATSDTLNSSRAGRQLPLSSRPIATRLLAKSSNNATPLRATRWEHSRSGLLALPTVYKIEALLVVRAPSLPARIQSRSCGCETG